jgi:hypothetical protein
VSAGNLARPSGPSEVVVSRNPARPSDQRDIALIDLLDRLLDRGVVLAGDITLAVADIDLIYVGLRAMISSVSSLERRE